MKSYIITIEFADLKPSVWRKVIMPAGATFKRLHEVIQYTTNFQGEHLYEFDLSQSENVVVTNDDQAYREHKSYLKNKRVFEENLENIPDEFKEFEQRRINRLQIPVRKPQTLKIDTYLEKHKELHYLYDYGDGWQLTIKLDEIVDDYYFGYPTLLDGAGHAPPENIGGIPGYEYFLKAYEDETHPDHDQMRQWAEGFAYRLYDPDHINTMLKHIHYKKTEWNKIHHKNYSVIEDKYVK